MPNPSLLAVGSLSLALAVPAGGEPLASADSPFLNRAIQAVYVEAGPELDGCLDDPAWQLAEPSEDFLMVEPWPGRAMRFPTALRIVYDSENLYLGFSCADENPLAVTARGMERDGGVLLGDHVLFMLDSFGDRRTGYVFAVSPDGGRWDALSRAGDRANANWDGVWEARTSVHSEGWDAEIRIPFRTLGYRRNGEWWGINASRTIQRFGETGRWNDPRPGLGTTTPAIAGVLTGLDRIPNDRGLELVPYALLRNRRSSGTGSEWSLDAGGEVTYRFSPQTVGTLSVNTDFAETEVDQRLLNFSRFPQFFPDRRGFFLEGSETYRFASLSADAVLPFHSRRIGLSDTGAVVPIAAAGKLTGRHRGLAFAMTGAVLDLPNGGRSDLLFAGRASQQIGEESSMGAILTSGDPDDRGGNWVGGFDLNLSTTRLRQDRTLRANAFVLRSETTPHAGDARSGHAFGLEVDYPNEPWGLSAGVTEISDGFDPALGYVRRAGRRLTSSIHYLARQDPDSLLHWWSMACGNTFHTDLENELETASYSLSPVVLEFCTSDQINFSFTRVNDNPAHDFEVPGGGTVHAGSYWMNSIDASIMLSSQRAFGGDLGLSVGDYYGADWLNSWANLWVDLGRHVQLGGYHGLSRVTQAEESFHAHSGGAWVTLRFTPNVRWSNTVHYDSESDLLGLNSRFFWEYRPGSRIHLVVNQNYREDTRRWRSVNSELVLKGNLTLRF